jgi:hypothetical protein
MSMEATIQDQLLERVTLLTKANKLRWRVSKFSRAHELYVAEFGQALIMLSFARFLFFTATSLTVSEVGKQSYLVELSGEDLHDLLADVRAITYQSDEAIAKRAIELLN